MDHPIIQFTTGLLAGVSLTTLFIALAYDPSPAPAHYTINLGDPVHPECHVQLEDPDVAVDLVGMGILRWVEACEKARAREATE